MSENPTSGSDPATKPSRGRSRSGSRAKKSPASASEGEAPAAKPPKPAKASFPVFDSPAKTQPAKPPQVEERAATGDWPEPDAPSHGGGAATNDRPKRKRNRRKGKGGANPKAATGDDDAQTPASDPASTENPQAPAPRPSPRLKPDPESLSKLAWKIYLSEVSEEGVALVSDNDAKELSRRCFRLAEIFMEEQARRR